MLVANYIVVCFSIRVSVNSKLSDDEIQKAVSVLTSVCKAVLNTRYMHPGLTLHDWAFEIVRLS